jgi:hypothetical protein
VSVNASVTRTVPDSVRNVVVRTFEPSSYARSQEKASTGHSSKQPPRRLSRIAPSTEGEFTSGRQSQSIEPSAATSAPVRPSPISA